MPKSTRDTCCSGRTESSEYATAWLSWLWAACGYQHNCGRVLIPRQPHSSPFYSRSDFCYCCSLWWFAGMCLKEEIGDIPCDGNHQCPEGSFCDSTQNLCWDMTDALATCNKVTECGSMAKCSCIDCDTDGKCERIININQPCNGDNDCGAFYPLT